MLAMFRFSSVLGALAGLALALSAAGYAADALPLRPSSANSVEESTLRPSSANSVEESYQLGTGDKVRVAVFGEDDLGGEFQVDGNGHISLPLIGEVTATGETASGLEQVIADRLADGYLQNPRVSVSVSTYRPFYVLGEVNKPGEYPYVNGMSVLNAIALAGGYTPKANESVIYIRRNGSSHEEKVPADQMTRIWPGDVVRVPITIFWSFMSVAGPLAGAATFAYSIYP